MELQLLKINRWILKTNTFLHSFLWLGNYRYSTPIMLYVLQKHFLMWGDESVTMAELCRLTPARQRAKNRAMAWTWTQRIISRVIDGGRVTFWVSLSLTSCWSLRSAFAVYPALCFWWIEWCQEGGGVGGAEARGAVVLAYQRRPAVRVRFPSALWRRREILEALTGGEVPHAHV